MLLGIVIAFLAQIFIGASLVIDKILLGSSRSFDERVKKRGSIFPYVFWIGILDLLGLFLIPLGFHWPGIGIAIVALLAGLAFFISLLAYYRALVAGEATETLAVVGGFAPIAAYFLSGILIPSPLNIAEKIAFAFLVGGGFLMFGSEKLSLRKALPWILLSSVAIGATDALQKLTFLETNFITGFVLMKLGTALSAGFLLLFSALRREITFSSLHSKRSYRTAYFLNRTISGLGSILVFYAIKLDHPALIEAINGGRYVVIFLLGFLVTRLRPQWLKETFRGWTLAIKIAATVVIMLGLMGLGAERYYENIPKVSANQITWGITFSELMSKNLKLDWRENYLAIINDLHPRALRLIAYWDAIEPQKDSWEWPDLDWQMSEASRAHIPVIMIVGQKTPRWPECHYPAWVNQGDTTARENALMDYVTAVVAHYRGNPNLLYWQVENEPFLVFGECPPVDSAFLDKEIATVRALDPVHHIFETDGGEFGNWYRAASRADVFGPTLYRTVQNKIFGHITYPITPEFYGLRESINKWLTGKSEQQYVVSELGLEPWTVKQIYEIPISEQVSLFTLQNFDDTVQFARATQFDTFYLWGAEWWYAMKLEGNSAYWDKAKELIASGAH